MAFVPTLLYFAWRSYQGRSRRVWRVAGIAMLAVAGGAAYAAYLTCRFGTPTVYLASFEAWLNPKGLYTAGEMAWLRPWWDRARAYIADVQTTPGGVGALMAPARMTLFWIPASVLISLNGLVMDRTRLRWFYLTPLLLVLLPYWSSRGTTPTFEAIGRHLTAAFPLYAALGLWVDRGNWKPLAVLGLAVMAVLLAYASYCFARLGEAFVG